jgi:DNA-binding transcriptional regulator GbsR (MarR family)
MPGPRHRETVDQFVQLWGTMASTWGINRTMAQIHALLYCSESPLNTDDIMERLDISRGNANMNLRSLADWGLIEKRHLPGSRKDFFVAKKDVWHITAKILRERERREIKPVKQQLGTLRDHLKSTPSEGCDDLGERDAALCWRIQRLIELIDVFDSLFDALLPLIEEKNAASIKQLAQWAQSVEAAADE